jgi:hypothetical protein
MTRLVHRSAEKHLQLHKRKYLLARALSLHASHRSGAGNQKLDAFSLELSNMTLQKSIK